MRAEFSTNRKQKVLINLSKHFFENINKIDKPWAKSDQEKKDMTQISSI